MITKKFDILSIPKDKITSIKVSGAFHERLSKLTMEYSNQNGGEEAIKEALIAMKKEETRKNDFHFNFETLLILMKEIETSFEKEGNTKTTVIDVEVPDEPKSEDSDPSSEQ